MKHIFQKTALLVAFACSSGLVIAQETESTQVTSIAEDDILNMSLEQLLNIKVSTGSFLNLDLQSSPMSLTIITAEQIEASGARHLSDALEIYVPGFQYMINKWNGIIWGMRGVANDRNTKFIFLVNGQKLNTESRDGAMSELDLGLMDDVERIEVLRGPAGLVYGSGAIAGVVNVITKEYKEDQVNVSTKMQTWSMNTFGQEAQASVARKLSDDASIRVDIGARRSDGVGSEVSRVFGRPTWPYPQGMANPPSEGIPSAGSALSTPGNYKAGLDFKKGNLRIYSRMTHQVTNAGGWFPVDAWPDIDGNPKKDASDRMIDGKLRSWDSFYANMESWGQNRRQYVIDNLSSQASYTIPLGANELKLKAGVAAVTNRIQFEDTKTSVSKAAEERNTQIAETFGERRYNIGGTYLLTSKTKFQLAAGCEMSLYDIGADMMGYNSQSEKATHPIVSNVKYLYGSAFSEGVYHVTDKFDAHLGLRYDIHTRTVDFGGVVNPKVGLSYKFTDNHSVKLVYQQSANNASADNYEFNRNLIGDNGEPFVGDSYHFEDPAKHNNIIPPVSNDLLHQLKPERAQSIELMGYHRITPNLIALPSVSYNTISDMFAWNQALFRVVNAGKYSSVNVDLDLQYSQSKITLGVNHTIQQLVNMKVADQGITTTVPAYNSNSYDSSLVGSVWHYTPKQLKTIDGTDSMTSVTYNYIRDGITVDNKNFISLATHVSKVYADYKPVDWLTLHASARIFWGLLGRKDLHEYDASSSNQVLAYASKILANAKDYPYLGIQKDPMVKMNIGITFGGKDDKLKVSVHVYDLLAGTGAKPSINSLRWQQGFDATTTTDLYAMDYRSYALKLMYRF